MRTVLKRHNEIAYKKVMAALETKRNERYERRCAEVGLEIKEWNK